MTRAKGPVLQFRIGRRTIRRLSEIAAKEKITRQTLCQRCIVLALSKGLPGSIPTSYLLDAFADRQLEQVPLDETVIAKIAKAAAKLEVPISRWAVVAMSYAC